jgi:DNA-binding MarR family transcriptional regulator
VDDVKRRPDRPPSEEAVRLISALRGYLNETEIYIGAAGREAEMHRTDLAGLTVVMDRGNIGESTTPGQLSTAMRLSAPATSAMLDRLERLGHVVRHPHPSDRRSIVVEITDHARAVGETMFGRLAAHLAPVLAERTEAELAQIAGFLEQVAEATRAATDDIRAH